MPRLKVEAIKLCTSLVQVYGNCEKKCLVSLIRERSRETCLPPKTQKITGICQKLNNSNRYQSEF